jgi:hypothetical protein
MAMLVTHLGYRHLLKIAGRLSTLLYGFFIKNQEVRQSMDLLRILRKNDFPLSLFLSKNPKRKDGFSKIYLKGGKK